MAHTKKQHNLTLEKLCFPPAASAVPGKGSVETQALPVQQVAGSPRDWDPQVRHMYSETQHTASGEHLTLRRKLAVAQL